MWLSSRVAADRNGPARLFTVGHSNLSFADFAAVLKRHEVELVADVRGVPASGRYPHFSQPRLEKRLRAEHLAYLFLGNCLGAAPDGSGATEQVAVADYAVRRASYGFQAGLERLLEETARRPVVVMCAEEDPLRCHRFLMLCPELTRLGIAPLHIRKEGQIETQEAAEDRLLECTGFGALARATLFPQARAEALAEAYRLQAEREAFRARARL